ncbi:MAG: thiamine diphosphokinase [Rhodobacter sp.]|nr:thiamine diphosphokinase [Rhodobacter sp.]
MTLIGAAPVSEAVFRESFALSEMLVAADGGADAALRLGGLPDAVIGDLDSLGSEPRTQIPADRLHRIAEQDSTDFDKALRSIAAPLVLAVGFTGARLDHELAVWNTLARRATQMAIVVGEHDICFQCPAQLRLDLAAGTRLSLFPMRAVAGRSDGLRWPIDGIEFAPWGRVGTSNEALGPVTLTMAGPGMLVVLPRTALTVAVQALRPA